MAKGAMALIAIAVVCSWLIAFQYGRHYESSARAKERATLYTVYQDGHIDIDTYLLSEDSNHRPIEIVSGPYGTAWRIKGLY